nr:4879_t:CDS:10 [Entrophospora candida]
MSQQNKEEREQYNNVNDFLPYIEQIKAENDFFYKEFLEVLKSYKRKEINIENLLIHAKRLFKGYPTLLQRFNNFLIPGYRFEYSTDPLDLDPITIFTPNGILPSPSSASMPMQISPNNIDEVNKYDNNINSKFENDLKSQMTPLPTENYKNRLDENTATTSTTNTINKDENVLEDLLYISKFIQKFGVSVEIKDLFNNNITLINEFKQKCLPIYLKYLSSNEFLNIIFKEFDDIAATLSNSTAVNISSSSNLSRVDETDITNPTNSVNNNGKRINCPDTDQSLSELFNKYKRSKISEQSIPASIFGQSSNLYGQLFSSSSSLFSDEQLQSSSSLSPSTSPTYPPPKEKIICGGGQKKIRPENVIVDEFTFFESCRRFLANDDEYRQFLLILNLYSQGIINASVLVQQISIFIGRNDKLFKWFKDYVKYQEKEKKKEEYDYDTVVNHSSASGTSYKYIPESKGNVHCSGRDELCYQVLNDEWVSYSGLLNGEYDFKSAKNNQYETELYKCEDERYEFDTVIEDIQHTIAMLEPILRKINKMSDEDKKEYKLKPGLDGRCRSLIYKRAIRRIYGYDKGAEVVEKIHNDPVNDIPVKLNKVWSDVESKNYYRSFDHKGLFSKMVEKKNFTTKHFINEIENLFKKNQDILHKNNKNRNTNNVVISGNNADGNKIEETGSFEKKDSRKIQKFFKKFLIYFFDLPSSFFEQPNNNKGIINTSGGDKTMPAVGSNEKDNNEVWANVSKEVKKNINEVTNKKSEFKKQAMSHFFCNDRFYCFFRYLQILFERFKKIKRFSQEKLSNNQGLFKLYAENRSEINIKDPYSDMFKLIEKRIKCSIEASDFEESLVNILGIDAHLMFSVKKIVHFLTQECEKLLYLYKTHNKQQTNNSLKDGSYMLYLYQLHATNIINKDGHLYRINYDNYKKSLQITLLNYDSNSNINTSPEERWISYIYSYVTSNPTKGVYQKIYEPFLKR